MNYPGNRQLFFIFFFLLAGCTAIPVKDSVHNIGSAESLVQFYTSWNGDCSSRDSQLKVISKPTNGRITFKRSKRKIDSKVAIGRNRCEGSTVTAKDVYYTANNGFKGRDEFILEFTVDGRPKAVRTRFIVNVR